MLIDSSGWTADKLYLVENHLLWVKQCHKPPIWEWFIPTISGDDWGMVQMALFYPHYQKRMVDNGTLDITII